MLQPDKIEFFLPDWLEPFAQTYAPALDPAQRMAFVIKAARKNVEQQTGGPFAAGVFESETGVLVSLGVNLVTTAGLSILHAEMVAFAIAQRKLGTYDLGQAGLPSHELVTSTEPCAMCFGAMAWSGVTRLVTGAQDADARGIGFDEGPKLKHWQAELEQRGIQVMPNILKDDAAAVLLDYAAQGGRIYNSRESHYSDR